MGSRSGRQLLTSLYLDKKRLKKAAYDLDMRFDALVDLLLGVYSATDRELSELSEYVGCEYADLVDLVERPLPVHKLSTTRAEESSVEKLEKARRFFEVYQNHRKELSTEQLLEAIAKKSGYSRSLLSVLPYARLPLLCEMLAVERDWGCVFTARSIYKAGASLDSEFEAYRKSYAAMHIREKLGIKAHVKVVNFDSDMIEQRIRALRAQRLTLSTVCVWLNDDGWTTQRGSVWGIKSLRSFMRRRGLS